MGDTHHKNQIPLSVPLLTIIVEPLLVDYIFRTQYKRPLAMEMKYIQRNLYSVKVNLQLC